MHQSFKQTFSLIHGDFKARADLQYKELSLLRILRYLTMSCVVAVVLYRFQVFFYHNHMKFFIPFLKLINVFLSVRIDSKTDIGPGFLIYHSSAIYIGPNVTIGRNCHLAHQNTITPSPFFDQDNEDYIEGPTIGDNALLGCGASVIGNISLGNDVKVSINSVVDKSFPDEAVLIGVPARNVAKTDAD